MAHPGTGTGTGSSITLRLPSRRPRHRRTERTACTCTAACSDFANTVPVRDSKDPDGPALLFPATAFAAFTGALRAGRFPTP
ncbi:DUF397 domain-containing protein [Kitasatospora azatica]|uniref:DUF397 domain-containing protein n=1 Tax=Kitasatospora azatica TaxID=58347 RepID=UPI0022773ACA|nr:DUF397 domain-containing protein [Kitasatospora azatica]